MPPASCADFLSESSNCRPLKRDEHMEIKGIFPQHKATAQQTGIVGPALSKSASRLAAPALWLKRLALVGISSTFFLLGYWYPIKLVAFSRSWVNNPHYSLV